MKIRLTKDLPFKGMTKGMELEVIKRKAYSVRVETPSGFYITQASGYEEVDDGPED